MVRAALVFVSLMLGLVTRAAAQEPETNSFTVEDAPWDDGTGLVVRWAVTPLPPGTTALRLSREERPKAGGGPKSIPPVREAVSEFPVAKDSHGERGSWLDTDRRDTTEYRYFLTAVNHDSQELSTRESAWMAPTVQWFNKKKLPTLIMLTVVCGSILGCMSAARRGKPIYIRPIAGLKAIEEAVGRATEMGRPVLFVPGTQDVNEIQTVAGLNVLAEVARYTAEYDTHLEVPTGRSLTMTAAREIVESSCLLAGRPDSYHEEYIRYISDEQFAFVADVYGWTQREKPAACFYLGQFFAESLIFSESGNAVGAVQIAGTAESSQLPFFVAACEYTLLGEELFAASACLSGEPQQLGTLRGQDLGKLFAAVILITGCVFATMSQFEGMKATVAVPYRMLVEGILGRDFAG